MTRDPLELLALGCDGAAIKAAFAELDAAALASIDNGPSARLLARWETTRSFAADGSLEPAAVEAFVSALTKEFGQEPPRWWVEQLASAKLRGGDEQGPPHYDVGFTEQGDRRGPLVRGPGRTKVRPSHARAIGASQGALFFRIGMDSVRLGSLPGLPDATIEIARARAESGVYFVQFYRGGFSFPLRAIGPDGRERWKAEVCGPDRTVPGEGYRSLTVEVVVLEPSPGPDEKPEIEGTSSGATGIAVFTAESYGVALDVFDPQTGARTLAWSSDFWFAR
ncbi:MAG: hypothetical protein R6X02_12050 [Enhygromyxa sp.]